MKAADIRKTFLEFFQSGPHHCGVQPRGAGRRPHAAVHQRGMNQFKDVFLALTSAPTPRHHLAKVHPCWRQTHNDLDNVGYTARHHTFFEMLGNFSFGDYFKHDAIQYAWELLTTQFKLPKEKLWVTVYSEDDEALRNLEQGGGRAR